MKWHIRSLVSILLGIASTAPSFAEDIEIYVGNESYRQGKNAKALIIFDNSGSMRTVEEVKVAYNPGTTYTTKGYEEFSSEAIYFSRGSDVDNSAGLVPNSHSDSRRFNKAILGCETAWERLRTVGYYKGYLREYQVKGNTGSWEPLPAEMGLNTNNPVDCLDDIKQQNPKNGTYSSKNTQIPNGYPINGSGNAKNDLVGTAYTTDWELALSQGSALEGGDSITLYTANYINYYHATEAEVGTESKSRLEVAKEAINELLLATPSVDFGLELFNMNFPKEGDRDGGRVVNGIKTMTDSARLELLNTLQEIDAETNTPLCESLMEAKRYLGGEAVVYGDDDKNYGNSYTGNTPPQDMTVQANGVYISPFDNCTEEIFIIMITDGEPTLDKSADNAIKALSNAAPYKFDNGTTNYLPVLSNWMYTNDINPNIPGKQIARFFTIGFGDEAVDDAGELLLQAAESAGGQYRAARKASDLVTALQETFSKILEENTSFTAPSVASNNFDRTRSLDSVYYAMFLPQPGTRWFGNLKKLRLKGDTLVDKNDAAALDAKGSFKETAFTFWNDSGTADGNSVRDGGAAGQLKKQQQRTFLVNKGSTLVELSAENFTDAIDGDLAADQESLASNINWARGLDVDDDNNDGSKSDLRADLMGDPLHSKPLVLSYGKDDIRILLGTNHGFMHMFQDSGETITENWAFMPQELMKNIPQLRANIKGNPKVYGVDSPPVAYFRDLDGDGIIGSEDKVWLFFGLRRGGDSYYALDITNPDEPRFMWHIDSSTSGFEELGQSWSKPVITFLKERGDKPVLVFGAGFSTNKDSTLLATPDETGRGVFIVDAEQGSLVKSFGPEHGIEHSVPGAVSFLDSDYDAFADRLYFSDTGGNVWRADLVGTDKSKWSLFKFASLSAPTAAEDRRFFYEPVVARALMQQVTEVTTEVNGVASTVVTKAEVPFDAVVIGSGSRPHPLYEGVQDKLFMLRDKNTVSQLFTVDNTPETITLSDLYEVVDTTPRTTTEAKLELQKDLSATKGWFYQLGSGEKSLSPAVVVSGVAFFTSYIPSVELNENTCELDGGQGSIYAFNLNFGTRIFNTDSITVTKSIPDVPEVIVPPAEPNPDCEGDQCVTPPGDLTVLIPEPVPVPCTGEDCEGPSATLKTLRHYLVIDEN
ncbi:pilus assembly protein [Rheinheimera fenheensis]|uniref:pilus assembly protein n=1 Tax=Rheinheimera fenheensis TaxID=3152295 RepID=UPI00325D49E0